MLLYCRKAPSLKHVFVLIGLTRCPETLCLVTSTLLCLASSSTLGYWSLVHCFHHEVCVCVEVCVHGGKCARGCVHEGAVPRSICVSPEF